MIYLSIGERRQRIVILDSHTLDALKQGVQISTPDRHVLIAYTPDIDWLGTNLIESANSLGGNLDLAMLDELLKRGLDRPVAPIQPSHPMINVLDILKGGKHDA